VVGNIVAIDRFNFKFWNSSKTVAWYTSRETLFTAEAVLLRQISQEISGGSLLDIGVGGGRTIPFLRCLSSDYTAIDYSAPLVEATRRKFKIDAIYCCDARDMRRFSEKCFDFVLFSYNGIDYVDHEDRLTILREVHRVLRPRGIFMFSSHNGERITSRRLLLLAKIGLTKAFLVECLTTIVRLPRHLTMKRYEIWAADHAIINDSAGDYSLLTYYITIRSQVEQARNVGFSSVEAYDQNGQQVVSDRESPWIYYLARKRDEAEDVAPA
jgi:SAM-dependent methyltransferase